MARRAVFLTFLIVVLGALLLLEAQTPRGGFGAPEELDPFKGVTAHGVAPPGLFSIKSTGVATKPVRDAAGAFLASLTPEQRKGATFPVESDEWRRWTNTHRGPRAGLAFADMTETQHRAA